MVEEDISFVIHHSGWFVLEPMQIYVNGETSFHYKYSADYLTYFELIGLVKDVCRLHVAKIYYRVTGPKLSECLRTIYGDKEVEQLKDYAVGYSGFVPVYIEHVREGAGVNQNLDVENLDVNVNQNQGSSEAKGKKKVTTDIKSRSTSKTKGKKKVIYASDEDKQHETDDNWEVASIDHMSDNDDGDEEVQLRLKVKNYYKLVKGKGKSNGSSVDNTNEAKQVKDSTEDVADGNEDVADLESNSQPKPTSKPIDMLEELRRNSGQRDLSGYESNYDSYFDHRTPFENSDNSESDPKEGQVIDKVLRYPIFDPRVEWNKIEPVWGMRAANCNDMQYLITCYGISHGYEIKFKMKNPTRVIAICAPKCCWRIYDSWMQNEQSFKIKSMNTENRCVKNYNCKLDTTDWLARMFADTIRDKLRYRIRDMKHDALEKYQIVVSESMCMRAKGKAILEICTALKQHYSRL